MTQDGKKSWLSRLRQGLGQSSSRLTDGITGLVSQRKLDADSLQDLEELLIAADLGVNASHRLSQTLADQKFERTATPQDIRAALAGEIETILAPVAKPLQLDLSLKPHVILVCGVNGSGKTTTIGKLASQFRDHGHSVTLVAGDTFRAAACEQLQIWGERTNCPVVSGPPNADAAGLIYAALEQAQNEKTDILLIDTAGRLQNKATLMDELKKIVRVIKKRAPEAPHDCLLVMDATVGQNAHSQVEAFNDAVNISALVVTKLDGSAKGGVVVSLAEKFGLPVVAIGVGEGVEDLHPFEASAFARSLLGLD
jgi:fused signal recognition particle receptor